MRDKKEKLLYAREIWGESYIWDNRRVWDVHMEIKSRIVAYSYINAFKIEGR